MPLSLFRRFLLTLFILAVSQSAPLQAQQNIFNVPTGTITSEGEVFFQEQFNFSRFSGASNTSLAYGLGNEWEIGLNYFNADLYQRHQHLGPNAKVFEEPGRPDFMGNVQTGLQISPTIASHIGTQAGYNLGSNPADRRFQNFSWWINSLDFDAPNGPSRLFAGACYCNKAFGGRAGCAPMLGLETPLWGERLLFQFDAILGKYDTSVMVIGAVYNFHNRWQLSLGAQIPSPGSGNAHGLVLEWTFPGFPLRSRHPR